MCAGRSADLAAVGPGGPSPSATTPSCSCVVTTACCGGSHGLVPVAVEDWHGWIMVNASGTAAPVDEFLDGIGPHLAGHEPERLVVGATHSYELAANWKLIVENYHECFHCPAIHPELCAVSPPTSGENTSATAACGSAAGRT